METRPQTPQLSTDDLIDVLGAFALAVQAGMPASAAAVFRQTLGVIADHARLDGRLPVAAVLDQLQAAWPSPTARAASSNEATH